MIRLMRGSGRFWGLLTAVLAACGDDGGTQTTTGASDGSTGGATTSSGTTTGEPPTTSTVTDGTDGTGGGATGTTSTTGETTGEASTGAETTATTSGATTGSTGPAPFCGDGEVDDGEACDDGAGNADDAACTSACQQAACGDGLVHAGVEACDDGNDVDDDACGNDCALGSCGDGKLQQGEVCDDGNDVDTDACLSTCLAASCGDGFVQAGVDECDDANADDTDACLATCKAAKCGDAVVQAGVEECDDGNAVDDDACRNSCEAPACGDGVKQVGEECDDGNMADADGCTSACTIPQTCKDLKADVPAATDGVYTIDLDGAGGKPSFKVFCDMTTMGGGWMVIERSPLGAFTIGRAFYQDVPANVADPANPRFRFDKARMTELQAVATDMRIDCRGSDYLVAAASNLYNGSAGPNNCNNWTVVTYKEAQLKGNKVMDKKICTWHVGKIEGCAGAWHIDEHAQVGYGCQGLPNFPWKGVAITTNSADTFATDPNTLDAVNPVHDCHKPEAVRWTMLR
jgi:cysteine-rich repeat protein